MLQTTHTLYKPETPPCRTHTNILQCQSSRWLFPCLDTTRAVPNVPTPPQHTLSSCSGTVHRRSHVQEEYRLPGRLRWTRVIVNYIPDLLRLPFRGRSLHIPVMTIKRWFDPTMAQSAKPTTYLRTMILTHTKATPSPTHSSSKP